MATKMKTNSIDIVNAVRNSIIDSGNLEYESRIPVATRYNLSQIGELFKTYQPLANAFLSELVNRIAFVLVKNKYYQNPLREFKRGELGNGTDIEEVFVGIAHAHTYNPAIAETEVFARELPDVSAAFHRMNRQDFYKVTIHNNDLYNAFLTEGGVTDMIAKITDSMYSGNNYDEYLIMRHLISDYIDHNKTYDVTVSPVTDEASAKSLLVEIKTWTSTLQFLSSSYNIQNVPTFTNLEDMVIFVTPRTKALIDVEALAVLFHLEKADIEARIIEVDTFGTSAKAKSTVCIITDRDFYLIYDKLFKFTEIYNAQGLYWNYFLHVWQLCSTSTFSNFIRFTTDEIEETAVSSVTLSPQTSTAMMGSFVQFVATVSGTGNYSQNVLWDIDSDMSTINGNGLVSINPAEKKTTLTITAKALSDTTKTATATLNVTPYPGMDGEVNDTV